MNVNHESNESDYWPGDRVSISKKAIYPVIGTHYCYGYSPGEYCFVMRSRPIWFRESREM